MTETILVVDDNANNLKLLQIFLKKRGYPIETAVDGRDARAKIHALRPRLVLLDVQLPGINGLDLTREIKADPELREILIVAVTSYAMTGDRERMLEAGFDGYISKPLKLHALEHQIDELLRSRRP